MHRGLLSGWDGASRDVVQQGPWNTDNNSTDLRVDSLFGPDTPEDAAPDYPTSDDPASGDDPVVDASDMLDVTETVLLADGVAVPIVRDFDPETDRLVLDFTGRQDEAPFITINLEASPGNAVVEADGVPVTLVLRATRMTCEHVVVVMNPPEDDPDETPQPLSFLLDGGDPGDAAAGRLAMQDALATGSRDALIAGPGGDEVSGGEASEAIFGSEGNDTLSGHGGRDELYGDAGDDVLSGGAWADYLDGGEGNDTLRGGTGADLLFGGEGDDLLVGGAGNDGLQGGTGADTLLGGPGDDVIDGTFLSGGVDIDAGDLIRGGDGNDSIMVGAMDTVSGGAGSDLFIAGEYVASAASPRAPLPSRNGPTPGITRTGRPRRAQRFPAGQGDRRCAPESPPSAQMKCAGPRWSARRRGLVQRAVDAGAGAVIGAHRGTSGGISHLRAVGGQRRRRKGRKVARQASSSPASSRHSPPGRRRSSAPAGAGWARKVQ
jgi:Ca2+-binding RTX toxin-like protein